MDTATLICPIIFSEIRGTVTNTSWACTCTIESHLRAYWQEQYLDPGVTSCVAYKGLMNLNLGLLPVGSAKEENAAETYVKAHIW